MIYYTKKELNKLLDGLTNHLFFIKYEKDLRGEG